MNTCIRSTREDQHDSSRFSIRIMLQFHDMIDTQHRFTSQQDFSFVLYIHLLLDVIEIR